jgi:hypothetical protein
MIVNFQALLSLFQAEEDAVRRSHPQTIARQYDLCEILISFFVPWEQLWISSTNRKKTSKSMLPFDHQKWPTCLISIATIKSLKRSLSICFRKNYLQRTQDAIKVFGIGKLQPSPDELNPFLQIRKNHVLESLLWSVGHNGRFAITMIWRLIIHFYLLTWTKKPSFLGFLTAAVRSWYSQWAEERAFATRLINPSPQHLEESSWWVMILGSCSGVYRGRNGRSIKVNSSTIAIESRNHKASVLCPRKAQQWGLYWVN